MKAARRRTTIHVMALPAEKRVSYVDDLAAEATSDVKHEWLDGEVWAMAGGTPEHSALAASVTIALGNALRGRPCRVFSSDLRIRSPEAGLATYPDVAVVRGRLETHPEDPDAATNPVVIVEVLGDSTEAIDRGKKLSHYRRLASLREVVFVSQHEPRLERYHRGDDGRWVLDEAGPGEAVELAAIGARLAVDDVYFDPLAAG